MATPTINRQVYFLFNSVALHTAVVSLDLNQIRAMEDKTAMGATSRAKLGGLMDNSFDVEFVQDFAASGADSVDATISAAHAAGTAVAIEIRPVNTTVSTTNPKWTGNVLVASYTPIGGSVGGTFKARARFEVDGALTRATA